MTERERNELEIAIDHLSVATIDVSNALRMRDGDAGRAATLRRGESVRALFAIYERLDRERSTSRATAADLRALVGELGQALDIWADACDDLELENLIARARKAAT